MKLTDYKHAAMTCPKCGAGLNASLGVDNDGSGGPRVGDKMICGYCANVLVYDPGDKLRLITDDELAALALDYPKSFSSLLRLQNAAAVVIQNRKRL